MGRIRINRKGISGVKTWIPLIIIMVMIGIFMIALYQNLAAAAAISGAKVTSKELGFEIDAAYAAPGSISVMHEVPLTEGYPAIGSVLLNHGDRKVCTSQFSQDEMWGYIFNTGLTAYVGGHVQKKMWYNRERIHTALFKLRHPVKMTKLYNPFSKSARATRGAAKAAKTLASSRASRAYLKEVLPESTIDSARIKAAAANAEATAKGKSPTAARSAGRKAYNKEIKKSPGGKAALKKGKRLGKEAGAKAERKSLKSSDHMSKPGRVKGWAKGKIKNSRAGKFTERVGKRVKGVINRFGSRIWKGLQNKLPRFTSGLTRAKGFFSKNVRISKFGAAFTILTGNYWSLMSMSLKKHFKKVTKDQTLSPIQMVLEGFKPFGIPVGHFIGMALGYAADVIDFLISYWPMYKTIDAGHEASDRMLDSLACYKYVSSSETIEVGPPNCGAKVKRLEVDLTAVSIPLKIPFTNIGGDLPVGEAFKLLGFTKVLPGDLDLSKPKVLPMSESTHKTAKPPEGVIYDEEEKCLDAPNALISYEDPVTPLRDFFIGAAPIVDRKLAAGAVYFALKSGNRVSSAEAKTLILGPRAICSIVSAIPEMSDDGTRCKTAFTLILAGMMLGYPEQYFSVLWGGNIIPADEYHYMSFPLQITIDKFYDPTTGESEISVRKAL